MDKLAGLGLFDNLFGKRHNVERGKDVETDFDTQSRMQGYDVKRTGIGSDHKRSYRDLSGKKHTEVWESKRNDSPLSERQKKKPALKVYRSYDPSPKRPFGVTRVEDRRGNELKRDVFTGKYKRVPKRQESNPFDFGFSSSSSGQTRKRRKKDDFSFF